MDTTSFLTNILASFKLNRQGQLDTILEIEEHINENYVSKAEIKEYLEKQSSPVKS